jgi:hypothetical protein
MVNEKDDPLAEKDLDEVSGGASAPNLQRRLNLNIGLADPPDPDKPTFADPPDPDKIGH